MVVCKKFRFIEMHRQAIGMQILVDWGGHGPGARGGSVHHNHGGAQSGGSE